MNTARFITKYVLPNGVTVIIHQDTKAPVVGAFNPGTPVAHPKAWVATRSGAQQKVAYDRVSAPRLSMSVMRPKPPT